MTLMVDLASQAARGIAEHAAGAQDTAFPREQMLALATSRRREDREAVALRSDVPLGLQAALACDGWHEVRAAVARNPMAARSVLENLARDKHRAVVQALLENPAAPRAAIEELARHRKAGVREAAERRLDAGLCAMEPGVSNPDAHIPELMERVTLTPPEAPFARAAVSIMAVVRAAASFDVDEATMREAEGEEFAEQLLAELALGRRIA